MAYYNIIICYKLYSNSNKINAHKHKYIIHNIYIILYYIHVLNIFCQIINTAKYIALRTIEVYYNTLLFIIVIILFG